MVTAAEAGGADGATGWIGRLGLRNPVLAGTAFGVLLAVTFLIVFDLMSRFRAPIAGALVAAAGGLFAGLALGWYYSFWKRTGSAPPW
jgi:O-antigen/teichoic acid export membrane protein